MKQRVLMFMPGLGASALGWGVHLDFAAAVRSSGLDFRILSTGAGTGGAASPVEIADAPALWNGVAALAMPALRARSLLPSFAALARWLRRSGGEVDVLHVEIAYPHGVAAALAVRASGWRGPIVSTPMGEDVLVVEDAHYGFRRFALPRRLVSWGLRQAAAIRCISPLVEQALPPGNGLRRVIPLNVSAATVTRAREDASARAERRREARAALERRLGLRGEPLVAIVGRLHPFKGAHVAIDALAALPNVHLLIAGPSLVVRPLGDTATRLRERAQGRGVADRVHFLGPVPGAEVLDLLAGVDVLAVPSLLESLNKVSVEAAAVGTPFVVTETTGIASFAESAGVGRVVPPRDDASLAKALEEAIGDRGRPSGDAAAFVERFSPQEIARRMCELYEALR